jgi:hypothetical protein
MPSKQWLPIKLILKQLMTKRNKKEEEIKQIKN